MAAADRVKVSRSSGNVFLDLGFSAEESEHLLVRSDLMIEVQKAIASQDLKVAAAARRLGLTAAKVRDLQRGRMDLFTTDALIDMLARLGIHVRLVLRAPRRRLKVA